MEKLLGNDVNINDKVNEIYDKVKNDNPIMSSSKIMKSDAYSNDNNISTITSNFAAIKDRIFGSSMKFNEAKVDDENCLPEMLQFFKQFNIQINELL